MNHCHVGNCYHTSVKYCQHCQVVYCANCHQEWRSGFNWYPYQTYPWNTQTGWRLISNAAEQIAAANITNTSAPNGAADQCCNHGA